MDYDSKLKKSESYQMFVKEFTPCIKDQRKNAIETKKMVTKQERSNQDLSKVRKCLNFES